LIICNSIPTICAKIVKIGPADPENTSALSEQVRYNTKLVAKATFLEDSEKLDKIEKIHVNIFHLAK